MDKLFLILNRVNTVLFLFVLIGAAGSIVWMAADGNQRRTRGAVEVNNTEFGAEKSLLLNFDKLENITGANTKLIRLTAHDKSAKFSSGGYASETRNVVFFTESENVPRWLFKEHKNRILVAAQLSSVSSKLKEAPTRALYFEYVSNDTNQDGTLSSEDHLNIGLTKPNGTDFVEVLNGVSRVLSYGILDDQNISVVYQKGRAVRHAKFSVVNLKLFTDQEIVSIPSTL